MDSLVEDPFKDCYKPKVESTLFGYGPEKFNNPSDWKEWHRPGLFSFAYMKCTNENKANVPHEEELDHNLPVHMINADKNGKLHNPESNGIQIMWIGHATLLVQLDGLNILLDPVFSERCSPVGFTGPKRYRPVPCRIENLPRIDAVVISHNHYDHLEKEAVKKLQERFKEDIRWFVPMKMKGWFCNQGCIESNVHEMTWWQKVSYNPDIQGNSRGAEFYCVPAQHWSQRGPHDAMQTLWCGWVVKTSRGHTFYYTGDTGYCPVFKQIGEKLGPMDLSAIPIGCYAPKYFMKPQHIDPGEAVQIHKEVRSKRSVGIHWGTFDGLGSHEHYLEPKQKLEDAAKVLKKDEFFTVEHGQIKFIPYGEESQENSNENPSKM